MCDPSECVICFLAARLPSPSLGADDWVAQQCAWSMGILFFLRAAVKLSHIRYSVAFKAPQEGVLSSFVLDLCFFSYYLCASRGVIIVISPGSAQSRSTPTAWRIVGQSETPKRQRRLSCAPSTSAWGAPSRRRRREGCCSGARRVLTPTARTASRKLR